jgi:ApaG protein
MSEDTKYQLDIKVETAYISEHSAPTQGRYVFTYSVTITNVGDMSARLLHHHWIIANATGSVISNQDAEEDELAPKILPGESYRHTCEAVIDTPIGSMQGNYQMIAGDGSPLEVTIPTLTLADPKCLH